MARILCSRCGGKGHVLTEVSSRLRPYYCAETFDDNGCIFFTQETGRCQLKHRLHFRVPETMQESHVAHWGYYRPGYHHRRCPDRRLAPEEP
jgi:hypothetical protein